MRQIVRGTLRNYDKRQEYIAGLVDNLLEHGAAETPVHPYL
ncbi:MAG: hypothetical protein JWQ95_6539 [Sphaerisporangium sp.]|jgi:hypothetical protein|nr:hypothetical protein [Sphaerisporangium sp.]